MPQHTVGLLEVTVIHHQGDVIVHPSSFGAGQIDLLEEIDSYLKYVELSGGVSLKERYFTKVAATPRASQRDIRFELDYGHYGSSKRVREYSTGKQTGAVKITEVASDGLRLVAAIPTTGKFALMAHEVIGLSSVAGIFASDFKRWFSARNSEFRIEIEYLEDSDAWEEFLDGAELKELTFIAHKPAKNNRAGRPTREIYEVLPNRRGDVLPRKWLDSLRQTGRLPANQVLSVGVDEDDIEETRVVVSKDKRRRTISIGAAWPRFTWEIEPDSNKRPSDSLFFVVTDDLIVTRFKNRGIIT